LTRSHRSSTERRLLAALLLAGLAAAPAGAVNPDEARAKARAALADPQYQHTLPQHEETLEPGKLRHRPHPERPPGDGDEEGAAVPDVSIPSLGAGAFLGKVVFTVLIVVVALLILGWILREVVDRRRKSVAEARPETPAAAAAAPQASLSFDDASRLAAEGRYAEAVHALLLAAIRHFAERSRTAIQPSRTSRELVRTLPLGPDAREAFTELVRTVELSLFGGAPVGAADYERNLARFQALTRRPA
jgi:Domain of unknown function (DUF4129)